MTAELNRQASLKRGLLLSATILSSVLSGAAAHAVVIEEVKVTAQKREQLIQDIPLAVTAFGGEALRTSGVYSTMDLQYAAPSLSVSSNNGVAAVYIRGIGSDAVNSGGDPSTAIHYDGVYIARLEALMNPFFDIERVEILRGPQGTLYGRNAAGGSINIISVKPSQETSGYVSAKVGNYDRVNIEGAFGGALTENLSARVAVMHDSRDGFTENVGAMGPDSLDDMNIFAVRGSALLETSSDLDMLLVADYTQNKGTGPSTKPLDNLSIAEAQGATIPDDWYQTTTNFADPHNDVEGFGLNLTTTKRFDDITVKLITAYREHKVDSLFDSDGTDQRVVDLLRDQDAEQYSAELQVSGSTDRLNWLVGAFYFNEDITDNFQLMRSNIGANIPITGASETEAWAIFGQGTYAMTDALSLTLGIRYSDEEKTSIGALALEPVLNLGNTALQDGFTAGAAIPLGSPGGTASWDDVSPKASIEYAFAEDALTYVSVTKAFKSGGFNLVGVQPAFEPEEILAYEAGVKGMFDDGRLYMALSGFYYDYDDLQVQAFAQGTAVTTNAAKATVKGVELELSYAPGEYTKIGFMGAWLDATYDSFPTDDPQTGLPTPLDGNRLRNAPKWSATLSGQHTVALAGDADLTFSGELNYKSAVFFDQFNTAEVRQPGFVLLNARIAYNRDNYELALWGRNLTDKKYLNNAVRFDTTGFNAQGYLGNPREVGVELGLTF